MVCKYLANKELNIPTNELTEQRYTREYNKYEAKNMQKRNKKHETNLHPSYNL